jgi:tetratricopeptide (TPR) repeat protein
LVIAVRDDEETVCAAGASAPKGFGGEGMKNFGMRVAVGMASCVLLLAAPGRLMAQAGATIHGHVNDAAGIAVKSGEVRLSTDKNPSLPTAKFEYTFPLDANGDYKGTVDKPGNYIAGVFSHGQSVDFMPAPITAGQDKQVDFDMTRKEYIDKMDPADRDALEEYKKKIAETNSANSKIENLNKMLIAAQADIKAGSFDTAAKSMTDATAAKPDEPILWETLGDAQLGQADAAAKAAKASHATDASLPDKYGVAIASYQKALSLNAASASPKPTVTAIANNQLGQAYGRLAINGQPEKAKDAATAYEAAAKADPTKAGSYYYNEAATLFNGNDMDDAAAAADKAITADPAKADAYYIKGQALVQKATVDASGKISAPPDCVAAYQKYLELAPTGMHAEEVKGILAGIGAQVKSSYKAGKK